MEGDLAGSKPYYFGFTGMIDIERHEDLRCIEHCV